MARARRPDPLAGLPPEVGAALREVQALLAGVPSMSIGRAALLARLIADHGLGRCLELGCQHGKGTAYLAATLRALGRGGALTTIDRAEALALEPSVHGVLAALGLAGLVTVHIEPRSLTWRLMRFLEAGAQPRFDLCYLDAAHSWDVTGFAFCLVDRLLVPGGWLVLDDLDWTYERMLPAGGPGPAWLARMPPEEVGTPQVRKVWELLVRRHPGYGDFAERDGCGVARKRGAG